jgi:hypothetical protein
MVKLPNFKAWENGLLEDGSKFHDLKAVCPPLQALGRHGSPLAVLPNPSMPQAFLNNTFRSQ